LFLQEFALPSSVLGPVECCEFSLFAAICASVAMMDAPEMKTPEQPRRDVRRFRGFRRETGSKRPVYDTAASDFA
ncbi:MAG: hypothetical protein ACRD4O_04525, partial [Bryobacteraceae bacterium]